MDIINFIAEQLNNKSNLEQIGKSVGAETSKVQEIAQLSIPALLKALERNASTPEGADALDKALEQHKNDEVDDFNSYLNNVDKTDGAKIIQHIFSGNNERVQKNLSKQTGLNLSQVSGILVQLAPIIMGLLGKKKKEENVNANGISGLLSGLLGQGNNNNNSGIMNVVTNLLDSDKDGDVIDDIGNILGGFLKK